MTKPIKVIRSEGVPAAVDDLPLSPGLQAGDFVFLSAQCSADEEGQIVNDTLEGEVKRTFDNICKVLAGAGLGLKNIVQVRCYLADRSYAAEFNRIYAELFEKPYPVRTTLAGCLPCEGKIAVDVVAYAGG